MARLHNQSLIHCTAAQLDQHDRQVETLQVQIAHTQAALVLVNNTLTDVLQHIEQQQS